MPMRMASSVCSSSLTQIGGAPTSPHSLLSKSSRNKSWLSGTVSGQHGSRNPFQPNGIRKSSSSAAPHHAKKNGLVVVRADGPESDVSRRTTTTTRDNERSEADILVDGMTFGELCDEFECISSPAVEATARQLVRDILELREGNRALAVYAIFVEYKDPLRSFKGREKYKRPSWIRATLDTPTVAVQGMVMNSTSTLDINWTVRGRPKLPPASFIGGDLVLSINSKYTLNQISGQVIQQVDKWDLSESSPPALAYFWATRLSYSAVEAGKDTAEAVAGVTKVLDSGKDDFQSDIYPDPNGDPRKFFQVDNNPQKDFYQVGLFIALIYLLVQFLKLTI